MNPLISASLIRPEAESGGERTYDPYTTLISAANVMSFISGCLIPDTLQMGVIGRNYGWTIHSNQV